MYLDISFETMLARALVRDAALFGSTEVVERRYRSRYIPGQQIYIDSCHPMQRASIVIDNNETSNPLLVKGFQQR